MTPRRVLVVVLLSVTACGRIGMDEQEIVEVDALPPDADDDPYLATVRADSPIALWRFEEGSSLARPTIGSSNARIAGLTARGAGVHGRGLAFDGRTTRIDVAGLGSIASVEMWVRPLTRDDQVRFLVDCEPIGERYSLYTSDAFTIAHRESAAAPEDYAKAPPIERDVFTHLVVTFDGTRMSLYVDGVRQRSVLELPLPATADVTVVGDTLAGSYYKFEGVIDELAFYAAPLSAERVLAHLTAGR